MTAGRAIAHAERSPVRHPALLHGAQLWVALPKTDRGIAPDFTHHPTLPMLTERGLTATCCSASWPGRPGRAGCTRR